MDWLRVGWVYLEILGVSLEAGWKAWDTLDKVYSWYQVQGSSTPFRWIAKTRHSDTKPAHLQRVKCWIYSPFDSQHPILIRDGSSPLGFKHSRAMQRFLSIHTHFTPATPRRNQTRQQQGPKPPQWLPFHSSSLCFSVCPMALPQTLLHRAARAQQDTLSSTISTLRIGLIVLSTRPYVPVLKLSHRAADNRDWLKI
jgi:hypothetical protein